MSALLVKTSFYLLVMISSLVTAFVIKDVIYSNLLTSFGLITGIIILKKPLYSKSKKMNKIEKLNLINGNFSSEEAKEILMNVFLTKVRFHEVKNFSSQVRFGKDDETAKIRIPQLKEELEKVLKIVSEAETANKKMIITSEINISLE